ncbi:MAG: PLDc N-terminal domain-containing protein [Thermofilum sp.]|nr:PLDc N-terminal domain-containing protein [Thermofilum sp.]
MKARRLKLVLKARLLKLAVQAKGLLSLAALAAASAFAASVLAEPGDLGYAFLAFLVFGGIILLIIGLIAVWILLAVWVYRDAKKRGMEATLWLLLVLLTGIIGLIVYLIVRREHPIQQPPPPPPPATG